MNTLRVYGQLRFILWTNDGYQRNKMQCRMIDLCIKDSTEALSVISQNRQSDKKQRTPITSARAEGCERCVLYNIVIVR